MSGQSDPAECRNHPQYLAYFDCFGRGQFFEAHEVLESIWLPRRGKPGDTFLKGLIQLAGGFVHVRKDRPGPALALFKLALGNLRPYPPICADLDLCSVVRALETYVTGLNSGALKTHDLVPPVLRLRTPQT